MTVSGEKSNGGLLRVWRTLPMAAAAMVAAIACGAGAASAADGTRVPKPAIVVEKGDKCVADTAIMRRDHMKFLKHQRDQTVHDGIRTPQFSIKQCVECHASGKDNSVVGSNQNFCQGCHSYAAVKLDCFECHASRPGPPAATLPAAAHPPLQKAAANAAAPAAMFTLGSTASPQAAERAPK